MIYIWRCITCGEEAEVDRHLGDIDLGPSRNEAACMCDGEWERIIKAAPGIMFEDAYDKGILERTWRHNELS